MKRESSPAIEAEFKQTEKMLLAQGATALQSRAIPLFSCYAVAEAKHADFNPTDAKLLEHLKNIVVSVLEELGDLYQAEVVQEFTQLDEFAPTLAQAFDMQQPIETLHTLRGLCSSPHKSLW